MTLPLPLQRWDINQVNEERMQAVAAYGFTERQARFLVAVMIHSGVFVERQFCTFAGITHGQKSHDFLKKLIDWRFATAINVGPVHRGRLVHVHYKPLYAAIGEPDNRHRKPAPTGRWIERLMILDAVIDDRTRTWLGTEGDKRRYFMRQVGERLKLDEYPRLRFGDGAKKTDRLFPDKLPIGLPSDGWEQVFLYLVNRPHPMDFRVFLVRHAELLRSLHKWTIRVLVPEPFAKAIPLFGHAARDQIATPAPPATTEELVRYCRACREPANAPLTSSDARFREAASIFRWPRFRAMYRVSLDQGDGVLWAASSHTLASKLESRDGRFEFVRLSRQYLHLSSLVGVA